MVEQAIELDEDPLEALHTYANQVLPEFIEGGSRLDDHPLLRNDTIINYYEVNNLFFFNLIKINCQ